MKDSFKVDEDCSMIKIAAKKNQMRMLSIALELPHTLILVYK